MKLYDLGLVVGRFQTFHLGHKSIIDHALELCERVVVYVGSSQTCNTESNPFSYNLRKEMIEQTFDNKSLIIRPLPDIGAGNNDIWGRYILGLFESEFGKTPDLYITGCEKERPSWFPDNVAPKMDELRIARNNINISATECRKLMIENKYDEWKKLVPYNIYKMFKKLRNILVDVNESGSAMENDL